MESRIQICTEEGNVQGNSRQKSSLAASNNGKRTNFGSTLGFGKKVIPAPSPLLKFGFREQVGVKMQPPHSSPGQRLMEG